MIRLLLARHGTVFADGETKVMVGALTDRAMSDAGRAEIAALGERLKRMGARPLAIHHGVLVRQRETAEMLAAALGAASLTEVPALDEISYGAWEGKAKAECIEQDGAAFDAFKLRGEWPEAIFGTKRSMKEAALRAWLDGLHDACADGDTIMAVSSMGTLRTLYGLLDPAGFSAHARRGLVAAKTGVMNGHWCEVELQPLAPKIVRWNEGPAA